MLQNSVASSLSYVVLFTSVSTPADADSALQERRIDALVIAEILKVLAKRDDDLDWLRVDCVTGHGVGRGGSM